MRHLLSKAHWYLLFTVSSSTPPTHTHTLIQYVQGDLIHKRTHVMRARTYLLSALIIFAAVPQHHGGS